MQNTPSAISILTAVSLAAAAHGDDVEDERQDVKVHCC
jgi:hypothetical protein